MKNNEATRLINKLNRETKEDKIIWTRSISKPNSLSGSDRLINDICYTSRIDSKGIRLYKFQSKFFYEEDMYEWTDRYKLEFIDTSGNSIWEFPDDAATISLYESVRYKTADVEGFFKSYLGDEPEEDSFESPF